VIRSPRRLHRRLSIAVAACVATVGLVFGVLTIGAAYTIEDRFFERMLLEESTLLEQGFRRDARWPEPRRDFMQVASTTAELPQDIARILIAEPSRREIFGEGGRHYHVRRLAGAPSAWLVAEVSRDLVVRPMRSALVQTLVVSLSLLTLISVWVAVRVAARTTAPLSRLASIVEGITPTALPNGIASTFGNDEVGILARGLDGLTERLRAFVAREQAFTRDVSHELRTPLAVLRGTTERLLAAPTLHPADRPLVVQAAQSVTHLEQTVQTLLTLAREDAVSSEAQQTPLRALVEEAVLAQAVLLEGKTVVVHVDVAADAVLGAPQAIARILLANLIGNAFAHSSDGRVDIVGVGRTLRICNDVREPAADVDRLGMPFVKGEQSAGWGLGLSIVRRLCARCGLSLAIDAGPDHFFVELSDGA
jgi:signal transduction histidine kinase